MALKDAPKCCGVVVWSTAGPHGFWFCRGCKREVPEPYWGLTEKASELVTITASDIVFINGIGTFTKK